MSARWAWLALVLLLLPGCSGCGQHEDDQSVEQPFAGREVELVVPRGLGLAATWEVDLNEWSAQTGATYRITEYDASAQPLSEAIGAGSENARLLIVPVTAVAELAAANVLTSIPDEQLAPENLDWNDLFFGLRENIASVERRPTVVPTASPVLVCYFRRDLLEAAGLAPPQTWQDYQRLLDTLNDWAPGLTAVEPWSPEFRATMFLARAAAYARHPENYSLWFDIATGEPLVGTPGFVRALEEARQAMAKMPADVKTYGPAECRREFLAGRAALAISLESPTGGTPLPPGFDPANHSGEGVTAQDSSSRPEAMRIGFVRLPGVKSVYNRSTREWEPVRGTQVHRAGFTAFRGVCAGVSAGQDAVANLAAWNLLSLLAREHLAADFPGAMKSIGRESQWETAPQWFGNDLSAEEFGLYFATVADTLRDPQLVAELPVVGHARFRAALTEGLNAVLDGSAAPEAALQQTAARFREIMDELGADAVRNSYRRSLGLSPSPGLR